jgi:hypothetical protein
MWTVVMMTRLAGKVHNVGAEDNGSSEVGVART